MSKQIIFTLQAKDLLPGDIIFLPNMQYLVTSLSKNRDGYIETMILYSGEHFSYTLHPCNLRTILRT